MRRRGAMSFCLGTVGLAAILAGVATTHSESRTTHSAPAVPTVAISHPATGARCARPAPATVAGYTALWAKLPVAQWGGADVSISVRLADGREVWLYGDTFSTGRFVHSTAIVQNRGCLHVSHAGAQLLPNSGASWSWIVSATRYGSAGVKILAETVHRTGTGPWDFATGRSRYAIATVSGAGDVTFGHGLPGTVATPAPVGPLIRVGPGHVEYARVVHHEIQLTDGHLLVTTCQNWDDGTLHPVTSYRPIFSEQAK
jgi:hypothetical protein